MSGHHTRQVRVVVPPTGDATGRRAAYRKVNHLYGPILIDSVGTRRRLQALAAIGYGPMVVSRELGRSRSWAQKLMTGTGRVHVDNAQLIAEFYEKHWDDPQQPTSWAVMYAYRLARRNGYAPPMAWDNIDDPNEQPKGV